MSRAWERVFFIFSFITQGSSYISPYAYGIMHRLHHAHTDTEKDPHSPVNSRNIFHMMWLTKLNYNDILFGRVVVNEKFKKDLPSWFGFEKYAHNWITRIFFWIPAYCVVYYFLATEWWMWLFLPVTLAMGAIQGACVNWLAHKYGYENYKMTNTSKNIIPLDLFFWGEAFHNNHHKFAGRPNNAIKWFEFDPMYAIMRLMHFMRIIRIKAYNASASRVLARA